MKTIDEQLEDALARITQLESDATASASLLTESGHQHERFRQEIATLTKEKDALAVSTSAEQIAALSALFFWWKNQPLRAWHRCRGMARVSCVRKLSRLAFPPLSRFR